MIADPTPPPDRLLECEQRIGYEFQDRKLLRAALTHASSAEHRLASNERLEFLGDAILGCIVCEMLYRDYPDYSEGHLTRIKSTVVSRQTCAKVSAQLGLEKFLILGKGMTATAMPTSLLSDVLESLIAAIYLDGGFQVVGDFIRRLLAPEIHATVAGELMENAKSTLQQLIQKQSGAIPHYVLMEQQGPDHSKQFRVAVVIAGRTFTSAWGRNKKEAEQRAASNALAELHDQSLPHPEPVSPVASPDQS
ncbi:MAG: ribonuclease III [Planctomycetota bacterium]